MSLDRVGVQRLRSMFQQRMDSVTVWGVRKAVVAALEKAEFEGLGREATKRIARDDTCMPKSPLFV
jgi:hypothetical protein